MSTEKQQLCNLHNQIKKYLEQIYRSDRNIEKIDDVDALKEIISDIVWRASEAVDLVDLAYERGNAMENRMRDYRSAIEGLGFTRDT